MNNLPNCPKCNSEYVYEDGALLVCPECAHEWNPAEVADVEEGLVAIDANGNKLADGDTVTLIKDLLTLVNNKIKQFLDLDNYYPKSLFTNIEPPFP